MPQNTAVFSFDWKNYIIAVKIKETFIKGKNAPRRDTHTLDVALGFFLHQVVSQLSFANLQAKRIGLNWHSLVKG